MEIKRKNIECPQCGHHYPLEVDPSNGSQSYYEECPACCAEFHIQMDVDEVNERVSVSVDGDDEQIF